MEGGKALRSMVLSPRLPTVYGMLCIIGTASSDLTWFCQTSAGLIVDIWILLFGVNGAVWR